LVRFLYGARGMVQMGAPKIVFDRHQSAYQVSASAKGSTLFISPPPLSTTSYFTCLLLRTEGRGELQYRRFDRGAAMFTVLNRFCCDLV